MPERFHGVKAVFFDVDNTLYDFEDSMALAFEWLRKRYPELLGAHDAKRLGQAYWSHYRGYPEQAKSDLINRDADLFRRIMWAGALRNLGLDDDAEARSWLAAQHPGLGTFSDPEGFARVLTHEFQRMRPEHWRAAVYPGAHDALRILKPRFTLGAITNGPSPVQRPKLEAFGYREFFPDPLVFVSGEFGTRKPDPAIFLAAAKAAGADPRECAMVGDAREFDMPAKAVGFRTILFDGKREGIDATQDPYPPDAVVTSYREILQLLG